MLVVGVIEGFAKLLYEGLEIVPGEESVRLLEPQGAEVGAIHILHGDERGFTRSFKEIVNADNVWVTELAALKRFAPHVIEGDGVSADFVGKKLESGFFTEPQIFGEPDDAHAAGAEELG